MAELKKLKDDLLQAICTISYDKLDEFCVFLIKELNIDEEKLTDDDKKNEEYARTIRMGNHFKPNDTDQDLINQIKQLHYKIGEILFNSNVPKFSYISFADNSLFLGWHSCMIAPNQLDYQQYTEIPNRLELIDNKPSVKKDIINFLNGDTNVNELFDAGDQDDELFDAGDQDDEIDYVCKKLFKFTCEPIYGKKEQEIIFKPAAYYGFYEEELNYQKELIRAKN